MAIRLEFWQKATLLLCCYGFFKEMKPSEPFLTPYLKAPPKNFTEEQLENEIYPVWTYSYLVALFFVFLFTDFLRYKPVIIVEGMAYLATRVLLIWASGVIALQFMELAYGIASGAEVAYYSYIYAVVDMEHYLKVTSYTRAAVLIGRMMSGIVGQLLVSLKVCDYLTLNYISMGSVCIAFVFTFLLPSATGNVFGMSNELVPPPSASHNSYGTHDTSNQEAIKKIQETNTDERETERLEGHVHTRSSTNICSRLYNSWKVSMRNMWHDLKQCYSNTELLKWSVWWSFGTCGEFQVENYVQNLWDVIYPSHNHKKIYNGGVTAISHLFGATVALLLGYLKVNWSIFGEVVLGIVSIADAVVLYVSAKTSSIWLAYLMYILFRTAYTFLITVASFQIARNVGLARYALVFGCNMFAALALQTILTSIVADERGLDLDVITQFVVYGSYFFILGALFLAKGLYSMTRVGWRVCWAQRRMLEDTHPLTDEQEGVAQLDSERGGNII